MINLTDIADFLGLKYKNKSIFLNAIYLKDIFKDILNGYSSKQELMQIGRTL